MGLLDIFRRKPPIRDAAAVGDFIDENAAFLMQKGIYEYSRARAGHYAKVLFREPEFQAAVEVSRWRAYPLGLAMVAEVVEGVLRERVGGERGEVLRGLERSVLAVFDRYPVAGGARQRRVARAARRACAPPPADRPASAQARHRHPGAVGAGLFRPDADPREAARPRLPDHPQLSARPALQHPREFVKRLDLPAVAASFGHAQGGLNERPVRRRSALAYSCCGRFADRRSCGYSRPVRELSWSRPIAS